MKILLFFLLIALSFSFDQFQQVCNGKADAVFLWVNGTSPEHLELMSKYGKIKSYGLYKDYGTLRFGLRSIVEYAPWIKRIFLVTNGEIPEYIDEEKARESIPQLILISHQQIMNESILPTFNSNVIESYLHHIPDISECILYLNDDMILGRHLTPSFFINQYSQLNVYFNGFIAPNKEGEKKSIWHRSVSHTNQLLNNYYHNGEVRKHSYPSHHCYFFLKSTLEEMENIWKDEFLKSRENKFRKENDIVISFLHAGMTVENNKGVYIRQRNKFYYNVWTANRTQNMNIMDKIASRKHYCICLNDNLGSEPNINEEIDYLYERYSTVLSTPCPFEKEFQQYPQK